METSLKVCIECFILGKSYQGKLVLLLWPTWETNQTETKAYVVARVPKAPRSYPLTNALLGPFQTSNFTCAESNANEKNPLFSLISIRFGKFDV